VCEKQHGDLLREILTIQPRKDGLNGQEVCVCVCSGTHLQYACAAVYVCTVLSVWRISSFQGSTNMLTHTYA